MARLTQRQYQQRLLVAMTIYVAVMLLVWPSARSVAQLPLKVLLAMTPLPPMFYALALMARRIRESDELEQRTHLVGLAVATGLTAALSLAGGFLAASRVLPVDGSILIWVFPVMMISYSVTRARVSRAYGGDPGCGEEGGGRWTAVLRLLLLTVAALYGWGHGWDDYRLGLACGIVAGLLLVTVVKAVASRPARGQAGS